MTATQQGSGPTVLRILLGSQLRRLREASGITREDAGYEIRASESKISRLELGKVSFKERDVADLLTLYGVDGETEQGPLLELARGANKRGWWHSYNDILPSWFESYVGLEEAAERIRTYEVQFVPGLLQTDDYARAVAASGHPDTSQAEIERKVSLRGKRQQLLPSANAPLLWAVVDEAALRRPIGGTDVMRHQLEYLIEMGKLSNVILQVMPFRLGGHAAECGAFTVMRFPESDLPDVVYVEQLTSALYLDTRRDVDLYTQAMERLCVDAATPERSVELIQSIAADM